MINSTNLTLSHAGLIGENEWNLPENKYYKKNN